MPAIGSPLIHSKAVAHSAWRRAALVCLLAIFLPAIAQAQPPAPTIGSVYPAGGQKGKTVEVTIAGANLQGAHTVCLSGPGVTAKVVKVVNPNSLTASIALAADAALGERDIRVVTPGGLSNRFRFFVGDVPEINEVEPNTEKAQAQRLPSLPVLVNGQLPQSDRDFFRFSAKAGQTLVIEVQARSIWPYVPDAVPGWLDACLVLYDAAGKELQLVDDFRFNPDPVLFLSVPKDGEYVLELRDVIYRGRPEFTYRLKIGELPYLTHFFPLGRRRDTPEPLELHGVNLPFPWFTPILAPDSPATSLISVERGGLWSNSLPLAVGDLPEIREMEPNDSLAKAQRVQAPVVINGRIQAPGDSDYFVFKAQQGQTLVMEVNARRLESPLDSFLTLYNSKGQELAENDDTTDPLESMVTHHADSRIVFGFPATDDYVLRIRDTQRHGGEEYAYRLSIAPPRPDYALRIAPEALRVGKGDTLVVPVTSVRKDGFGGEVQLAVTGLPPGFVASEAVIPAGQDQARLTISVPRDAAMPVFSAVITGTATLGNQPLVRKADATESVMQAFSVNHIVPLKDFLVAVIEAPGMTLALEPMPKGVLEVARGSEAKIVVKAFRQPNVKGPITLAVDGPPAGITVAPATVPPDKTDTTVTMTISKDAPIGARSLLLLSGTLKGEKETITRFAPGLPLRIVAPK